MKVKKIFCKKYDGDWHESLDYESELRAFRRNLKDPHAFSTSKVDELYLMFRNAAASVNTYDIRETDVPNPEICSMEIYLNDVKEWGFYIHGGASKFHHVFDVWPVVLSANSETLKELKDQIKAELGITVPEYELEHFECPEFDIYFCCDESVKTSNYILYYSKDARRVRKIRKAASILHKLDPSQSFGTLVTKVGPNGEKYFPYWQEATVVHELYQTLEPVLLKSFDLQNWQEGREILERPDAYFAHSDIETNLKLLTMIVRQERFVEGTMINMLKADIIQKILRCLKEQTHQFPLRETRKTIA